MKHYLFALIAVSTATVKITPADRAAIEAGLRSGVPDHINRAPAIITHVEPAHLRVAEESYPAITDDDENDAQTVVR